MTSNTQLLPTPDCPKCQRLCGFRQTNIKQYPTFFNAPVPSFGTLDASFLVVGLAPGLKGANQSGRPFTGDYAGIILYNALLKFGFAKGNYKERRDDGLELVGCRITNAVRCVPPENKPEPSEIKNCNDFLKNEIAAMPNLKLILSLGLVSHNAVLKALGHKVSYAKFSHGSLHRFQDSEFRIREEKKSPESRIPNLDPLLLLDSYHCSRYNINTGRLTPAMFDDIIQKVREIISFAADGRRVGSSEGSSAALAT